MSVIFLIKINNNRVRVVTRGHAGTTCWQYLVSDVDEEDKNEDNKQIVDDADSSNDAVNDLESKVTVSRP